MQRTLLKELKSWKDKPDRAPLLLRGARQVGKSFLVEYFGELEFDVVTVINFETAFDCHKAFDSLDPKAIIAYLEIVTKSDIKPGKTLLFLDEIQHCPPALMSLRYFYEKMPDLHVIGAGSLLEFTLNDHRFSFPVGRCEFLYLYPLSFRELLQALNHKRLIDAIDQVTITKGLADSIHGLGLDLVRQYLLVGGMPKVVRSFCKDVSFMNSRRLQAALLESYENDFGKYAKKTQHKYLRRFFERAPALVAQYFKYTKLDPDVRSRDLKMALEQLCYAGLIHRVLATKANGIPLASEIKENRFKLLFLDVGLL